MCERRVAEDCHEITRGPYREESLRYRAVWLAVCRKCHDELDDASVWPITRQLAVKLLGDPDGFDICRVNTIRADRGPIDMADVVSWLRLK